MRKKTGKVIAVMLITAVLVLAGCQSKGQSTAQSENTDTDAAETASELVIEIDPGHGGDQPGACAEYSGTEIMEKDLNLKIAQYMKEALEGILEQKCILQEKVIRMWIWKTGLRKQRKTKQIFW